MANVSLNIGLEALLSSQSALDTIGHNIANANTLGYSRQDLALSPARAQQLRGLRVGTGVQSDVVTRTVDELLNRRMVAQIASMSRFDTKLVNMQGIEALLGEPGSAGIATLLDGFFASMAELSSDVADPVRRTSVVESASSLTGRFRELGRGLADARDDAVSEIRFAVRNANLRGDEIVRLSRQIVTQEATGAPANDLRDQRDEALRELAKIVDIEVQENGGGVQVLVDGRLFVGQSGVSELSVVRHGGGVDFHLGGGDNPVSMRGGQLGGLSAFISEFVPELESDLDELARQLILEVNRVHSTGVPPDGGFRSLTGSSAVVDGDGDGDYLDERLASAGLPFEVRDGILVVQIVDESTGQRTAHQLAIDPARMTVGGLIAALNDVPGLEASLDPGGHVRLGAEAGTRFDFARGLDARPDKLGSFGGARASIGSGTDAPFALSGGDTLTLTGPAGTYTVTFDPTDFAEIGQATAAEVAAAINADPGTAVNGLQAASVGGQLVLQSLGEGSAFGFDVTAGSALGTLGLAPGTTVSGHDAAVVVTLAGSHAGPGNRNLSFRPTMDGEIGTTPGLQVEVFDMTGALVTTLDVGAGYQPGAELDVVDGVRASFGFGILSATHNDRFDATLVAASDSSDLLVAVGLGSFFEGTGMADIAVRSDIAADPSRLATSDDGSAGDNGALLRLLALQESTAAGLGASLGEFYDGIVGDVGFQIQSTEKSLEVESSLVDSLTARREQVSGVNMDEELVDMIRFEQAFGAAAQFIQVVNSINDEILNLI